MGQSGGAELKSTMTLPEPARFQSPAIALAVAAALLATGCGGTDLQIGGNPAATDVTYPAGADAICTEVAAEFAELQGAAPTSLGRAAELTATLAAAGREGERELAAIEPPSDAAADYRRYLDARGEVIDLLEDGTEAARDRDARGYEAARTRALEGAAGRERLARRAGLETCAELEGALAEDG